MMHRHLPLLTLLALLLTACGTDSKHFKIEGRFLHINQGEFYIYSEDGETDGIDTIKVEGGRFAYETACQRPSTLIMVFPNFSRQPVFAEPGKTVSIEGDASHLKQMEVKGTDDNVLMTAFRRQVADASPPETRKLAAKFAENHADSRVSTYIVKTYLLATAEPDLREALRITNIMTDKQPRNGEVARLQQTLKALTQGSVGNRLPAFSARDMQGRPVSAAALSKGVAVITLYASWNYDSMDLLRRLKMLRRQKGNRFEIATFSVDASSRETYNALRYDSIAWPVVCDGRMFEGETVARLGLRTVPANLLLRDGRIIARNLSTQDLIKRIEQSI